MADALGVRRRPRVPVPLITPWLSSLWIGLVTPVDAGVARPLVEGLSTPTVVTDSSGADSSTSGRSRSWTRFEGHSPRTRRCGALNRGAAERSAWRVTMVDLRGPRRHPAALEKGLMAERLSRAHPRTRRRVTRAPCGPPRSPRLHLRGRPARSAGWQRIVVFTDRRRSSTRASRRGARRRPVGRARVRKRGPPAATCASRRCGPATSAADGLIDIQPRSAAVSRRPGPLVVSRTPIWPRSTQGPRRLHHPDTWTSRERSAAGCAGRRPAGRPARPRATRGRTRRPRRRRGGHEPARDMLPYFFGTNSAGNPRRRPPRGAGARARRRRGATRPSGARGPSCTCRARAPSSPRAAEPYPGSRASCVAAARLRHRPAGGGGALAAASVYSSSMRCRAPKGGRRLFQDGWNPSAFALYAGRSFAALDSIVQLERPPLPPPRLDGAREGCRPSPGRVLAEAVIERHHLGEIPSWRRATPPARAPRRGAAAAGADARAGRLNPAPRSSFRRRGQTPRGSIRPGRDASPTRPTLRRARSARRGACRRCRGRGTAAASGPMVAISPRRRTKPASRRWLRRSRRRRRPRLTGTARPARAPRPRRATAAARPCSSAARRKTSWSNAPTQS